MIGDKLAQGAKSAVFSGGKANRNDPIQFHGTVATEERPDSDESWQASKALLEPFLASRYQPMNDRVLLRRIDEKADKLIVEPDAFARKPNKAEVLAVGEGMLIGGTLRPINLKAGDRVYYGEYNAEELELDGAKFLLVSAFDIRLKIRS